MVLVLFTLGGISKRLAARAVRSLAPLLAVERIEANVITDGTEVRRPARGLAPGTLIRVRPGERIPVDGIVVKGSSECGEAVLTGESRPCPKRPGSPVFAGSLNGVGTVLVRTTAAGAATAWGRISRFVRRSLARKGTLERAVDRAAAVFVPAVLMLAAAAIAYWSLQGPFDLALMIGLSVLVVACPCALGLAAPLATSLALGQMLRRGVLIRGGAVLEALASIRGVAFDKTGTLTTGEPKLTSIVAYGVAEDDLLRRVAGLEQGSEHPVAQGVTRAAQARGLVPISVTGVQAHPGQGVIGQYKADDMVAGNATFMQALGWSLPPALIEQMYDDTTTEATPVYVGWGHQVRGGLWLTDLPRGEAKEVITAIHELGLSTRMLSGDSARVAEQLAAAIGINTWRAQLSPEGKVREIKAWSRRLGPVAMVGDGLNDGPVLAAAAVGVAVGSSTDLARETADIVLPKDGLGLLPDLVVLARRVRKIILGNMGWALEYNLIALILAACGMLPPVLAAGLMAGSSLLVVFNSLRVEEHAGTRPAHTPDFPVRSYTDPR